MIESQDKAFSGSAHLFFILLVLMCVAFGIWTFYGQLDIVSIADGQVVPTGRVKHVQHFEGGIIQLIRVKEGDEVRRGQALVELEQLRSGASLDEIQLRINALEVDVLRLDAHMRKLDRIPFPEEIIATRPLLVKEANALFLTHQKSLASTINRLNTMIDQKKQRIITIQAKLENTRQQLPMLQEQLTLSEDLLKSSLTTRYKHIDIMRRAKEVEGEISHDLSALKEARHSLTETQEEMNEAVFSFEEENSEKLKKAKQELMEFSVRLKKFEDTLQKTIIRSPINGVVKKLYHVTRGGVIKPGDSIADIVPSEERLIIEAHLKISDIGYIRMNQDVFLQLPSSDAKKFKKLKGHVIGISPDTFTDDQGRTFYRVRMESDKSYFEAKDQRYRLYPGMVLLAYIHIGQRSVLEYLLDPFINTLSFALQER